MGYRSMSEVSDDASWGFDANQEREQSSRSSGSADRRAVQSAGKLYGVDLYMDGLGLELQRLARDHGPQQVREWADEGMPVDVMGKPWDMEDFRQRQRERPPEVPKDIERRNNKSVQRSRGAHNEPRTAGETQVPETVRDVISSPGRQLDDSIQRPIEERMGDNLGDVRIHTGPTAANACEDINARAFTVGNHVAFNRGEYDPESPEGQHVLVHELAHVRQQTAGAVSMLPQEGELRIDPDERLEREAEETAERVLSSDELGIRRMSDTGFHVQRSVKGTLSSMKESVMGSNESGIDLAEMDDVSGINERLYALAENQHELTAKVNDLSMQIEGTLFEKIGDAGTGEGLKLGMEEAGKGSGLPGGALMGKLGGAALQAIYDNREQVKEILGLKSEANLDTDDNTGSDTEKVNF